ncbi:MAG TPA: efflux RND transporter periplasmic adaptor subunit [Vicinamibacteria bacterium]|nr:efflux RND transporter periplasmic adaptor subunit [Vicinamibacteria bacterium]
MSKGKKIALFIGALVVIGGVIAGSVARASGKKIEVQTGKVGKKDLVSKVSASGEIRPKKFVNVSSDVAGRIVQLLIKEGDRVKRGQILARIDAKRYEEGARQSEASLAASRSDLDRTLADLELSRQSLDRQKKMHADKLVSDQVLEQAESEFKMKQAAVESQRKRIAQQAAVVATTQDDLGKTTVMAPMDGVVTSLQKEEGETVIGAQSFSPTVICVVADLSVMEVEILVDETDIRNLALGQTAEVRVDALEGSIIKGEVTEIGSSAIPRGAAATGSNVNNSNQAKDFKVTVTLKDPPATLRPGLNATADVITARREGVTAAPIQAVVVRQVDKDGKVVDPAIGQTGPSDGQNAPTRTAKLEEKEGVFVVQAGKAVFKAVKTGIVGDTDIEITEGVKDGEDIVIGSYRTLRTLRNDAQIKFEDQSKNKAAK